MITQITPFLWFDHQAEDAANFYVGIFKNSKITEIQRYPAVGQEIHGRPPGSVMTVAFELDDGVFWVGGVGPGVAQTRKFRNLRAGRDKVALVIDDLVSLEPFIAR